MKESLERQLVDNYPDLYEWYDKDTDAIDGPVPPLRAYGFSVGDGWYDLIDGLSDTLTSLDVEMEVHQVKQKFGGLRFYHGGVSDDSESRQYMALGAIRHAENMSFRICEECGASGASRNNGYIVTLCDECYDEQQ